MFWDLTNLTHQNTEISAKNMGIKQRGNHDHLHGDGTTKNSGEQKYCYTIYSIQWKHVFFGSIFGLSIMNHEPKFGVPNLVDELHLTLGVGC